MNTVDYSVLESLAILAFTLLICDASLGLLMKMRLVGKCRVLCEESESN